MLSVITKLNFHFAGSEAATNRTMMEYPNEIRTGTVMKNESGKMNIERYRNMLIEIGRGKVPPTGGNKERY